MTHELYELSCFLEQLKRLCCNFQPCDAADAQQSTAQEKEHSPHELPPCDNGTCHAELAFSLSSVHLGVVRKLHDFYLANSKTG